jgi:hypothetical protein
MSRATPADGADAGAAIDAAAVSGYLGRAARPLVSLVFLLPFIILYEMGTRILLTDPVQGTQHIVAFTIIGRFFALLGAGGQYLPALAVVAILLAWHIARKDPWAVKLGTLFGMSLESALLTVPLIGFGIFLPRLFPMGVPSGEHLGQTIILSLGAGVYEELVFRLILCTMLATLLRNVLQIDKGLSMLLLVLLSATLFSAYHYLGTETFQWRIFVFRTGAGIYFAAIFLTRGFGITSGTHVAYDILIALLWPSPA